MQVRKNGLWLMALCYCASCIPAALADEASGTEPLKLSSDLTLEQPAPTRPAAPANPDALYKAGYKAYLESDMAGAMSILKPAADAGHAPSQALLAIILSGSSMYEDAVVYFRKAAEQDNAEGLYGLGVMYSDGTGVQKDYSEARRLFTLAAEKGHKQAVNVMAQAYIKGGLGLDQAARQGPEALSWITRSADNNDLPSLDALAAAYLTGQYGLTPDPKKAEALTARANKLRGVTATGGKKKTK